jgi:uncharacterized membrane protein YcaP (DUF421 family)
VPVHEPDRLAGKAALIGYALAMPHDLFSHMFHLQLPVIEKLLRPIIVYLVMVALLRLFGKRELAQLNPFDLVVLLSLSNTVQNAIIGDDNSVTGGVIGAFSLLTINWLVASILYRAPRLNRMLQGHATVLIRDGKIDHHAVRREALTHEELVDVIHRQGFERISQIRRCVLEPNGTFYVEAVEPSSAERQHGELIQKLEALTREVAALRSSAGG